MAMEKSTVATRLRSTNTRPMALKPMMNSGTFMSMLVKPTGTCTR